MSVRLIDRYERLCGEIIGEFCQKQGLEFERWLFGEVGGVAVCSDDYYQLNDIVYDLKTEQPKGMIRLYNDYTMDFETYIDGGEPVRYGVWVKGREKK